MGLRRRGAGPFHGRWSACRFRRRRGREVGAVGVDCGDDEFFDFDFDGLEGRPLAVCAPVCRRGRPGFSWRRMVEDLLDEAVELGGESLERIEV